MPDSYKHGTGLNMEIQEKLNVVLTDTIEVVLRKTESGFENITAAIETENGK